MLLLLFVVVLVDIRIELTDWLITWLKQAMTLINIVQNISDQKQNQKNFLISSSRLIMRTRNISNNNNNNDRVRIDHLNLPLVQFCACVCVFNPYLNWMLLLLLMVFLFVAGEARQMKENLGNLSGLIRD